MPKSGLESPQANDYVFKRKTQGQKSSQHPEFPNLIFFFQHTLTRGVLRLPLAWQANAVNTMAPITIKTEIPINTPPIV